MNPDIAADFQTLAQIAITLTGFTGIIGAVQARGGRSANRSPGLPNRYAIGGECVGGVRFVYSRYGGIGDR